MIIVMEEGASKEQVEHVLEHTIGLGFQPHPIYGEERVVIGAIGSDRGKSKLESLAVQPGVEAVTPILKPYKLVSRELKDAPSVVDVDGVEIGGKTFAMMAGPCSVEGREQIMSCAEAVKKEGGQFLRGGAFKPRTSPYAFQGMAEEGLQLMKEAKDRFGLRIVTEVMTVRDIELIARYADMFQIGARNMANFSLLKEIGQAGLPVLLKRGMSATMEEWLMSAEYIASEGNNRVVLCERGIRTFETYTRNTLDLSVITAMRERTHLPIIIDPSHGTGVRAYVPSMAAAAVAAGANGLMIEIHQNPEVAFSDGAQSLEFPAYSEMMDTVRQYLEVAGKSL